MTPYYSDGQATIYHADCLTIGPLWTHADVLVTDPPYGRAWRQGHTRSRHKLDRLDAHDGIEGDRDTTTRDTALAMWGDRPGMVFGDPLAPYPAKARQVLVYVKPPDAGTKGAFAGFRRDIEMVYVVGPWAVGLGGQSSVLHTKARNAGNPAGLAARYGHPHAKPLDVMYTLIRRCPPGTVVDPFCGSGTTLVAARMDGRQAIGVEIEERYCERAANRLSQRILEAT